MFALQICREFNYNFLVFYQNNPVNKHITDVFCTMISMNILYLAIFAAICVNFAIIYPRNSSWIVGNLEIWRSQLRSNQYFCKAWLYLQWKDLLRLIKFLTKDILIYIVKNNFNFNSEQFRQEISKKRYFWIP